MADTPTTQPNIAVTTAGQEKANCFGKAMIHHSSKRQARAMSRAGAAAFNVTGEGLLCEATQTTATTTAVGSKQRDHVVASRVDLEQNNRCYSLKNRPSSQHLGPPQHHPPPNKPQDHYNRLRARIVDCQQPAGAAGAVLHQSTGSAATTVSPQLLIGRQVRQADLPMAPHQGSSTAENRHLLLGRRQASRGTLARRKSQLSPNSSQHHH